MTSIEASKKAKEKTVCSDLQHKKDEQKPNLKLGQLVRNADDEKFFSE